MENYEKEIGDLLMEIINDYKVDNIDIVNEKYYEHLGTNLLKKETPYILSGDVLCIFCSRMGIRTNKKNLQNDLYSVCCLMGIEINLLYGNKEELFFIYLNHEKL